MLITGRVSDEAPEELTAAAAAMVDEIMAKRDSMLADFAKKYAEDKQYYLFECKRHGDFLLVMMTRGGDKLASSINLGKSRTITPKFGNEPDTNGIVTFDTVRTNDGGIAPSPKYPAIFYDNKRMLYLDEKPDKEHGTVWYQGGYQINVHVRDFARPAEDDRIYFTGPGVTIFTPAGLGQSVFDKIMAAVSS